jgi:hypothetical protein
MTIAREEWTAFIAEQHPSQSAQQCPPDATLLCDLPEHGLIRIAGDEARDFMQNQFCNDVKLVNDNFTQLNGYCTPKGRLLAFFRLFKQTQTGNTFYLSLPRERITPVLKRLQMYVLMSRVELSDASDELITIGLAGPEADALLSELTDAAPVQTDTCVQWNGTTIIRIPGAEPRFLICGSVEQIHTLWSGLSKTAQPASESAWSLLDIDAGIPQVVDATTEAFVPQMLNMQSINALSFKKGCYPGQEIVARMHYLGKQKRSMFLAEVATELQPGERIVETGNEAQTAGEVVSAAPAGNGNWRILAVLQIKSAQNASLCPENRQNFPLSLKDLPYTVELEGDGK